MAHAPIPWNTVKTLIEFMSHSPDVSFYSERVCGYFTVEQALEALENLPEESDVYRWVTMSVKEIAQTHNFHLYAGAPELQWHEEWHQEMVDALSYLFSMDSSSLRSYSQPLSPTTLLDPSSRKKLKALERRVLVARYLDKEFMLLEHFPRHRNILEACKIFRVVGLGPCKWHWEFYPHQPAAHEDKSIYLGPTVETIISLSRKALILNIRLTNSDRSKKITIKEGTMEGILNYLQDTDWNDFYSEMNDEDSHSSFANKYDSDWDPFDSPLFHSDSDQ